MKHGMSADVEVKQGPLKRNTVAVERGNPWKRIPFALEKGTPLKRIPFAVERGSPLRWISFTWRRGPPWGESNSLWRRGPHEANPFAEERGKPLRWIYSLGEGDPLEANPIRCREGGKPLGVNPIHLEKGTPMKRNHSLEGDSHLFRRRGLPWTESPIVAILGARNEWFMIALLWKAGGVSWTMTILRDDESGRGWQRASDGGETLGEAMTGKRPPQHDSARARLSWSHLEWRMPRSR